ncbi:MAG: triose-phosphate isomerase [Parachlamydiaceae bacterium]|nr:triose-phosphate isomerase [Parachlamydiaceae bacterium]
MDNQRLILWHWEALYPYDLVAKGLCSLNLPEEFPKDSMYIALPHDYLVQALDTLNNSQFHFGSSDMLDATPETFTSSIAASFLVESKANFVLIGKALDRNQIKESSESINYKIRSALKEKITPFFCFGETREEFEDGHTEAIIKKQLSDCLTSFTADEIKQIYFIYDTPGALKTISEATPRALNEIYEIALRQYISLWGEEVALQLKTICYLEPFKPLPKELFENSPFAGFYFKMIDANLSFFCEAAKEIAPFFGNFPIKPIVSDTEIVTPTIVDNLDKPEESARTDLSTTVSLTPDVPALAPTQFLAIQTDLSIHNFSNPSLSEEELEKPSPLKEP